MPRPLRLALLALAGLAAALLVALGASALLDRPAQIASLSATVEAPKPEVWAVLTDFAAYDEWNPVLREASGEAREGSTLELEAALPGHDPESLDAEVLIARPDKKLRWQDRLVVPGLRDWEYEFVLEPLEPGRVLIVQQLRVEGLLAPFADEDAARQALVLMADALGTLGFANGRRFAQAASLPDRRAHTPSAAVRSTARPPTTSKGYGVRSGSGVKTMRRLNSRNRWLTSR